MLQFQLLVGTVGGTAARTAQGVASELENLGHRVRVNMEADQADLTDNSDDIFIICTSNTGAGDLPANLVPLYVQLTSQFPNIAGRRYGLINLGDSSYPNFAQAGEKIDLAFSDIGAVRVGEPLVIDAIMTNNPMNEARTWVKEWVQSL